jgi:hypothetical protein
MRLSMRCSNSLRASRLRRREIISSHARRSPARIRYHNKMISSAWRSRSSFALPDRSAPNATISV